MPLLLCWLAAVFYVVVVGKVALEPHHYERLAWMAVMSLVYVSFYFALGMAASCWSHRSQTALGLCLFAWITLVLVIPNFAPMAVKHIAPVPSAIKVAMEKSAVKSSLMKNEGMQWFAEMADEGGYDDGKHNAWGTMMSRVREEEIVRCEKIDHFYTNSIARKVRIAAGLSRVSPATSYVYAATGLAGTGPFDYLRFLDQFDVYLRTYQNAKNDQIKAAYGVEGGMPYDGHQFPVFEPRLRTMGASLNQVLLDVVLLVGGTVVLLLVSFVGFMRYDPR